MLFFVPDHIGVDRGGAELRMPDGREGDLVFATALIVPARLVKDPPQTTS